MGGQDLGGLQVNSFKQVSRGLPCYLSHGDPLWTNRLKDIHDWKHHLGGLQVNGFKQVSRGLPYYLSHGDPLWTDRLKDIHDWKHYLPQTTYAGGNQRVRKVIISSLHWSFVFTESTSVGGEFLCALQIFLGILASQSHTETSAKRSCSTFCMCWRTFSEDRQARIIPRKTFVPSNFTAENKIYFSCQFSVLRRD